jgi:hypothetical protein
MIQRENPLFCSVPSQTRIRTDHLYSLMAFGSLPRRCNGFAGGAKAGGMGKSSEARGPSKKMRNDHKQ